MRSLPFASPLLPSPVMRRPLWGPVVVWPVTVAALSAAGLWAVRRWGTPVHHVERERRAVPTGPAVAPPPTSSETDVQTAEDGVGPRYHRRYRVAIRPTTMTPEALIAHVVSDLNAFCPSEIARFETVRGTPGHLAVGDELEVHIASPWNGPVRVAEVTPTQFTLATLAGHMEAGQIRFSAAPHPDAPDALRFTIESWARSRDAVVDALYDTLGLARGVQGAMWTFFLDRVAEAAGERWGDVEVLTEREADA